MWKSNHKQKKGIYYSIAVIALGCLISSLYANRGIGRAGDYSVDLSALDSASEKDGGAEQNADGKESGEQDDAEKVQDVSATSVINPKPSGQEIAMKEQSRGQALLENGISTQGEILPGLPDGVQTTAVVLGEPSLSFQPENGMGWPVTGDVIMGFSMDKSIFFETLQQYRYNPAVYISADVGAIVSACARCQVTEIGQDPQLGTYVRTSLGDGYDVIYGQLAELQVKKDDILARGQVIGSVAENTIYFAQEGPHLYLRVEKDGIPVDPMELLQ